jgi:hypothetical protein
MYQATSTETIVACISCEVLDKMHVVELEDYFSISGQTGGFVFILTD